nr:hypothetical protein [Candidatus Bathyarchaeota archaeon]
MLTRLKKKFQNWIRSEAKIAHKVGLTPNQISALGLIFAVLSAIFYWRWDQVQLSLVMAPILLL